MTKDEEKQKQIREKTKSDAVSENARAIGQASTPPAPSGTPPQQSVPAVKTATNPPPPKPTQPVATKQSVKSDAPIKRSNLFIQAIPPFKGKPSNPAPADGNTSAAVNRLNVNASSFKPNPQAIAFTPVRSLPRAYHVLFLISWNTERFPGYDEWPIGRQPITKTKTHGVYEAKSVLWDPYQENDRCTHQGRLQPLQIRKGC